MTKGIYGICGADGGIYVGQAKNIRRRWGEHRYCMRRGMYAWGNDPDLFSFIILEEVQDTSQLYAREQFYFDVFAGRLYNTITVACHYPEWTPERRAKIVAKKTGMKYRPETKPRNISDAATKARAERMRAMRKGMPPSNRKQVILRDGRIFKSCYEFAIACGFKQTGDITVRMAKGLSADDIALARGLL